jgi:hypothetical protein
MADQKISELPVATFAAGADLLNIVQGGSNKKITMANFMANIKSPTVLNVDGGDTDTRVKGLNDDQLIFADASTDRVGFGTDTPTEKVDVVGSLAVSSGYIRESQTPQAISGVGSGAGFIVNATTAITTVSGSGAITLTIADGVVGQRKTIAVILAAAAIGLTGSNVRATTITTSSTGATLQLQWISSKWQVISNVGFSVTL